ncbi:hypothetical protein MMC34_002283 [Xylographa carneopallida]|nr:hypothetical protein [Xylographa carneopallida]
MAFNAKNLTYESKEPAFLRKLKNEYGGSNADRHESQLARPRKPRNNDDDDEPTYVDEESNDTITKAQYEAILEKEEQTTLQEQHSEPTISNNEALVTHETTQDVTRDTPPRKELVAAIGGIGKRRIAKVVGDDSLGKNGEVPSHGATVGKRSTKKSKKIKLSFDEEGADSY